MEAKQTVLRVREMKGVLAPKAFLIYNVLVLFAAV